MTGIVPKLDDTDFDALVEEARGLIPELAPEWTDHNLHDPGITIIDLLAWLVDQQIYRVGFVGPSLRRAFTRLMGIAPRAARQARFDVWPFPGGGIAPQDLTLGTEVRTDDLPDARFMLAGDVQVVAATIAEIYSVSESGRKPLGLGLTEGRSTLALPPAAGGGPIALDLDIDGVLGGAAGSGPAALGVIVHQGALAAAYSSDAADGVAVWDDVVLEERFGDSGWRALRVIDGTHGLTRSGVIRFWPLEGGVGTTTLRLRLESGFRPGAVKLARIGLNVLTVTEGWLDIEEEIGVGNGLPDQVFDFPINDIAGGAYAIESPSAGGTQTWNVVETFARSGPADHHVVADPDEGTLRFGNGINGAVPPIGAQLRHRPPQTVGDTLTAPDGDEIDVVPPFLVCTAGAAGNVANGLHWSLLGVPFGENLAAGSGGRDADTLDTLVSRARIAAADRRGLLKAEAIKERVAASGVGLARVEVLAARRPGARAMGSRTVLIVPDRAPEAPPGPPRADVIQAVQDLLEPARLLGERIYVTPPLYTEIDIAVEAVIRADAPAEAVRAVLEAKIRARFWDIARDPDVEPWPPGRPVTAGDIRALAGQIDDIRYFDSVHFEDANGRAPDAEGMLRLSERGIVLARSVTVTIRSEAGLQP